MLAATLTVTERNDHDRLENPSAAVDPVGGGRTERRARCGAFNRGRLASGVSTTEGVHSGPTAVHASTAPRTALHDQMRMLWEDHIA